MLAAGVMAEDRKEWWESEQDANQKNGNKRYGSGDCATTASSCATVGGQGPQRPGSGALVMDMSLWTFTEYRQREYIGTAVTIVRHGFETAYCPGKRQDFLNRMAEMPMVSQRLGAGAHPVDQVPGRTTSAAAHRARRARAVTPTLDAMLKQRFPDANTASQLFLYYDNRVSRGVRWTMTATRSTRSGPPGQPRALRRPVGAGGGARAVLDYENRKTKLVYAARPARRTTTAEERRRRRVQVPGSRRWACAASWSA